MTTAIASPEYEAVALAAVTARPELLDQLPPTLLYLDDSRAYRSLVADLFASGVRPELTTLIEASRTRKILSATKIFDIASAEFIASNFDHYVATLHQLAQRRRRLEAARELLDRWQQDGEDPSGALADFWEKLREFEPVQTASTILLDAPVNVLRRAREQGDPIPTGIPALDAQTRGGLRTRKALIAGGTAGAGKTSLLLQIGNAARQAGCAVACLMADEGREPAIIRLGQQLGYIREQIEEGTGNILDRIEHELEGSLIFFPDPDSEDDVTIEGVAESLAQSYPSHQKLLLLDSIQTVTSRATRDLPSIRERIMGNARAARRVAVEHDLAVVMTSEVNRSWYRARKEEERSSDLAAFAEARIEFVGDVLLAMRASDEDPNLVDVRIPKNRLGTRKGFLMRLDRERALFTVLDEDPRAGMQEQARSELLDKQTQSILQTLTQQPGLTQTQLSQVVGGNRQSFFKALAEVKGAGLVTWEPSGRSVIYRLSEVPK